MNFLDILIGRLDQMVTDFIRILPQLGIAIAVLVVTWVAAKFARRITERFLRRTDIRGTLVNLFETMTSVAIWVAGLMIASSILLPGVTPSNLLAVVGLGSVAVGFCGFRSDRAQHSEMMSPVIPI